jgi:hypothetical protein
MRASFIRPVPDPNGAEQETITEFLPRPLQVSSFDNTVRSIRAVDLALKLET